MRRLKILLIGLKDWRHRLVSSVIIGGIMGFIPAMLLGQIVEEGQTPISLVFGGSTLSTGFAALILCGNFISDERSRGTLVFLLSQPIRDWEIAFGKLLAILLTMLPLIVVNSVTVKSVASLDVSTSFIYFAVLFLYTFAGGGLLLFVSAQFKRLPVIFGMWCVYAILLSVPGAFFVSAYVPENWTGAFLIFLLILPFLIPLLIGFVEYVLINFPFMMTGTTSEGPGMLFSLLPNLLQKPVSVLPNFFVPSWNSTVLLLSSGWTVLEKPSIIAAFGSVVSLLSMGLLFGFLASKQFRKRTPGID
jgi:ABC-type transport system involved in multi-copper enzyme maturation permease subunit